MTSTLKLLLDQIQGLPEKQILAVGREINWASPIQQSGTQRVATPLEELMLHPSHKLKQVLLAGGVCLGKEKSVQGWENAVLIAILYTLPEELAMIMKAGERIGGEQAILQIIKKDLPKIGARTNEADRQDEAGRSKQRQALAQIQALLEDYLIQKKYGGGLGLGEDEIKQIVGLSLLWGKLFQGRLEEVSELIDRSTVRDPLVVAGLLRAGSLEQVKAYVADMKKFSPLSSKVKQVGRYLMPPELVVALEDWGDGRKVSPDYSKEVASRIWKMFSGMENLSYYIQQKHPRGQEKTMDPYIHRALKPTESEFGRARVLVPKAKRELEQLKQEVEELIDWVGQGGLTGTTTLAGTKEAAEDQKTNMTDCLAMVYSHCAEGLPEGQVPTWIAKAKQWRIRLGLGEIGGLITRGTGEGKLESSLQVILARCQQELALGGQPLEDPWNVIMEAMKSDSSGMDEIMEAMKSDSSGMDEEAKSRIISTLWRPLDQICTVTYTPERVMQEVGLDKATRHKVALEIELPKAPPAKAALPRL